MNPHEKLDAWCEQVDELLANYAEADVAALGFIPPHPGPFPDYQAENYEDNSGDQQGFNHL